MNNRTIIRPKFWGDALWFFPTLTLIICGGITLLTYRLTIGNNSWLGLSVLETGLVIPIFFLLWIDSLSNRIVFDETRMVIKGFLRRKTIAYQDIKNVTFSDLHNAGLFYFNQRSGRNDYLPLPVWNHSINLIIDEIKQRAGIQINGYPDKINRANFNGKIWMLIIMAIVFGFMIVVFPNSLKSAQPQMSQHSGVNGTR